MTFLLNGKQFEFGGAALSVAALLESLQLAAATVAVERNEVLVPKAAHALTPIEPGDRIEVVTFVGGG
jgi:sulfur carrier protein